MAFPGPRIVFMGTPEFAVETLRSIIHAGYPVAGVITSPDKPSGRGLLLRPSEVKSFALENGLRVLQPLKLKDPGFLESLHSLKADLQVVVAFRMLPEEVWAMPSLGTFNLHASLLPQYRGAAPINWAVMNGETETGVTTFFLDHEIDTGKVILQEKVPIAFEDTAGDVHDRLMTKGAQLVVKTIALIASGNVIPMDQQKPAEHGILKTAPKIFRNDCRIDWKKDSLAIYNLIRGLSPYPTAWTELRNERGMSIHTKITEAQPAVGQAGEPGSLVTDNRSFLHVVTGKGQIAVHRMQIEGKRPMGVSEFLNGFDAEGYRFE